MGRQGLGWGSGVRKQPIASTPFSSWRFGLLTCKMREEISMIAELISNQLVFGGSVFPPRPLRCQRLG